MITTVVSPRNGIAESASPGEPSHSSRTPALTSSDPNTTKNSHTADRDEHDLEELAEEQHESHVHPLRPAQLFAAALRAALQLPDASRQPQQQESRGEEHEQARRRDEHRDPRHGPDLPCLRGEEDHQQEEQEQRQRADQHAERGGEEREEPAPRPLQDRQRTEPEHEVDELRRTTLPISVTMALLPLAAEDQRKQRGHQHEHHHLGAADPLRHREERLPSRTRSAAR